ncbi:GNAT family N-acetyltransferase [Streptomyces sp. NPDC059009]|uniref:GNAT family N-acetyltransferase n=1 Tax=Streptomyces sp. NPDC059009 TaxID=3346694 RepID=UPI0036A8E381
MIRTAVPAEAPALTELHARARATYYEGGFPDDGVDWAERWRAAIERPDGHVLCAVRDGRVAGLASFRTPEDAPADTVKLFQFHVDPDLWRTGIGGCLHAACVEEWRADGMTEAILDVHADNARAQGFYAAKGWEPLGAGDDGGSHVRMRLPIGESPVRESPVGE